MVLRGVKLFSGARVTLANVTAMLLLSLIAPIASAETESVPSSPIVINEIKPATKITGQSFEIWIELYNRSDNPVDISNYRIVRGSGSNALGGTIAEKTVMAPKSYYVVDVTKESLPLDCGCNADKDKKHLELQLWTNKADGIQNPGELIDSINYGIVTEGSSYGRIYDGSEKFRQFTEPTKGRANYIASPVAPTNVRIRSGDATLTEGQYTANRNVTVTWDIPSGGEATQYEIRLRHESGEVTRQTAGTTFTLTDLLDKDGTWSVQVRAQDVISPDWSDWSPLVTFKLDTVRPVVALTSNLLLVDPRVPYVLRASAFDANTVKSVTASLRLKDTLDEIKIGEMVFDESAMLWSINLPIEFAKYGVQYDIFVVAHDEAGNASVRQPWVLSFALPVLGQPIESGGPKNLDEPEDQNRKTSPTTFARYETPYSPAVAVQYHSLDDTDAASGDNSQDVIGAHRTNTQPSGSVNTNTGFAWQWIVAAVFVFGAGFVGWAVLGKNRE